MTEQTHRKNNLNNIILYKMSLNALYEIQYAKHTNAGI